MTTRRKKIYEGKAKILYEGPEPGTLIQYFKDDATAFNAQKKAILEGKGVINNRISEYVMTKLNSIGVQNHLIRRLNLREVGNWPAPAKYGFLAIIFAVIVALGALLDWKDQYEALQAAEQAEATLRTEYASKKAKAVNYDLYVAQLKEVEQSFGALVKQLPNRSEIDALLTDVVDPDRRPTGFIRCRGRHGRTPPRCCAPWASLLQVGRRQYGGDSRGRQAGYDAIHTTARDHGWPAAARRVPQRRDAASRPHGGQARRARDVSRTRRHATGPRARSDQGAKCAGGARS